MSDPQPAPNSQSTSRDMQRLLLIITAALAGFVACAGLGLALLVWSTPAIRNQIPFLAETPTDRPPPEAPRKFADPSGGPVSIEDNFNLGSDRWDRSQTRIVDGTYELTLERAEFDSYGLFLGESSVRDVDLALDMVQTAGPLDGEFGIRFRQAAPDDHLMFSISASGYYRLVRVRDRTYTSLVPWTRHQAIQLGLGSLNRLRLIAEGPEITGFINGMEVLNYRDSEPQAGQLTLGLVTFAQGGLVVRFDNLEGSLLSGAPDTDQASIDLTEDFSDPTTAPWSIGGATMRNGGYEIFVGGPVVSWQQPLPSGSSAVGDNFVLEVEATFLEGAAEGSGYGLMFADDGAFNFIALILLPQGGLTIYRNGDEGELLIPPVAIPMVNPGAGTANRLRIAVRGQSLTITINGEELPSFDLPPELSLRGQVGLIVQSSDLQGVSVRFDNFRLEEQRDVEVN